MNMLIGLTGPAGSGKSYCASYLQRRYGYHRVRFADPLKHALRGILERAGLMPGIIDEMIEGRLKEAPSKFLMGKSPRHAMQTLGTEWGRECIHSDFWTELTRREVKQHLQFGRPVVIEDVRFDNESRFIWDMGGRVAKISGRAKDLSTGHPSEGGAPWDVDIDNSPGGNPEVELDAMHDWLMDQVFKRRDFR